MSELTHEKAHARKYWQAVRDAIPQEERTRASDIIAEHILAWVEENGAKTLFLYDAMRSEVETACLADSLFQMGCVICYPRMDQTIRGVMQAVAIQSRDELLPGAFGTKQPPFTYPPIDPLTIDAVFVPGLAYTEGGIRLGYGGGYYDRFLPLCKNAARIGLCFAEQLADTLPAEPHDQLMQAIVTQHGWIKVKNVTIEIATPDDLPMLEEIEKECDEYFGFDPPSAAEHNRSLRQCLSIGDHIPDISEQSYIRENYHLYSIRKDDVLIGWLSLYLEYQCKDTVYLSVFYIKEAYRESGIGTEILKALTQQLASAHFKAIRLHCSLRNSTALRFWVKNGFDRILNIECNGNLFPENFAGMELMKIISPA